MRDEIQVTQQVSQTDVVITPQNLLEHWQGHRKITRKVIEAFQEDKLFAYSIGGVACAPFRSWQYVE